MPLFRRSWHSAAAPRSAPTAARCHEQWTEALCGSTDPTSRDPKPSVQGAAIKPLRMLYKGFTTRKHTYRKRSVSSLQIP
eukprot:scaffold11120_cov19-Tisochrysis_lutea.AAC.2